MTCSSFLSNDTNFIIATRNRYGKFSRFGILIYCKWKNQSENFKNYSKSEEMFLLIVSKTTQYVET